MSDRIKLIEEMLDKNPTDNFLSYAAALEYRKMGKADKAIEIIEGIIARDEAYLGGYYQLGKLYEEKNKTKKAIEIYRKGIAIAKKQNDQKTLGELSEAIMIIDEDYDGAW